MEEESVLLASYPSTNSSIQFIIPVEISIEVKEFLAIFNTFQH